MRKMCMYMYIYVHKMSTYKNMSMREKMKDSLYVFNMGPLDVKGNLCDWKEKKKGIVE